MKMRREMPAGLRAHTRYAEELFRVQSDMYRVYHMRNPQSFYNNEDVWELARYSAGQNAEPQAGEPDLRIRDAARRDASPSFC